MRTKEFMCVKHLEVCLENLKKREYMGTYSWFILLYIRNTIFPGGSDGKASAYNAGDLGSIPWSGRSPGEGNGNPLQYSCLENPMAGRAW